MIPFFLLPHRHRDGSSRQCRAIRNDGFVRPDLSLLRRSAEESTPWRAVSIIPGLSPSCPMGGCWLPSVRSHAPCQAIGRRVEAAGECAKVLARGQGGLLDVILDRGFAQNRTVYFFMPSRSTAAAAPRWLALRSRMAITPSLKE